MRCMQKVSVNVKWGAPKSIVAGGYIFGVAFKLLARTGNHQVPSKTINSFQLIVRLSNEIQDHIFHHKVKWGFLAGDCNLEQGSERPVAWGTHAVTEHTELGGQV